MTNPYETKPADSDVESLAQNVINNLQSTVLTLPKWTDPDAEDNYIEQDEFRQAYDVLCEKTDGFERWNLETVWSAYDENRLVFLIVRTILALTPPEWAALTREETGVGVTQGNARSYDRQVREERRINRTEATNQKIRAMFETAVSYIESPVPETGDEILHRFELADREEGLESVQSAASEGVEYSDLLRERYLGRPFASHKDSVSERVGDEMEDAVADVLDDVGVPYYRTKRGERFEGLDQAPDFFIPSKDNWRVLIEAKITADDGTARDKVTRIQHLATVSREREADGDYPFQVVACVDGRGFGTRPSDMRKLIRETEGKVFTFETLGDLVEYTDISEFKGQASADGSGQSSMSEFAKDQ